MSRLLLLLPAARLERSSRMPWNDAADDEVGPVPDTGGVLLLLPPLLPPLLPLLLLLLAFVM